MKKQTPVLLVALLLFLANVAWAQKLEAPKLDPKPSTDELQQLIKEGVTLHDKGDYDRAISRYERVLKENPDDVLALYEMGYSYFAQKNYRKSIEISYKAARYKSTLIDALYVQIGSCYDELGDPKNAIENYNFGIKLSPSSSLLHYNLAITYFRTDDLENAKANVKKAVALDSGHPSSHLLLSTVFDKGSYKVPSLLAALRFLVLEPESERSDVALQRVMRIMGAGVTPAKDGKNMSIVLETGQKKDEGDFESVTFLLGLMKAGNYIEKNKDKSEIELLVANFNSLFGMLSGSSGKIDRSKFTGKYYVPYFVDLKQRGHTEAFVYYVNQHNTIAGVNEWLEQNQNKVADFLVWTKGYQWPKMD